MLTWGFFLSNLPLAAFTVSERWWWWVRRVSVLVVAVNQKMLDGFVKEEERSGVGLDEGARDRLVRVRPFEEDVGVNTSLEETMEEDAIDAIKD